MLFSDKSFVMLFIWRSASRLWKHHCSQIVEMEISETFARFTAALAILPLLTFCGGFSPVKRTLTVFPWQLIHISCLLLQLGVCHWKAREKWSARKVHEYSMTSKLTRKKRKSNGFKRFSQRSQLRKDKVNEIRVNANGTRRNVPERCLQFYGRHEMFLLSHAAETITSRR